MNDIIKPRFKIKSVQQKADYGKFSLEPLEQGYGYTVGNALRRCLLSSLPGAAITQVKIEGVKHQFSTLPGLKEDIIELILNLKQIRIAYKGEKEVKANLEVTKAGEVKAGDIKTPANVKIVNKDLNLATLAGRKPKLKMQLLISSGYGYSPAEERSSNTLGMIPLDATFSPVIRVSHPKIEATRVGRRTDYDKLTLEIWTDGTIKPKKALEAAAEILVGFFKQVYQPVFETEKSKEKKEEDSEMMKLTVEELDLPTRIANALRRGSYTTVKDLIKANRKKISKVKNLGKKSLDIIIKKLAAKGVKIKA
jgi:DNA-directed RNA polymerase subunit alpha